jgi:glucosamine--fructose-6-phosphate aminotransferase (isomerizing)
MKPVLDRLRDQRADVVTVGPDGMLPVPKVDERLSPLLDILPLQRLALALALARGEDPDAPRGLNKITATM